MTSILIEIPKRSQMCLLRQEPFLPGMDYYSVLFLDEGGSGKFIRKDYCPTCWQKIEKEKIHSHWKGKVPKKTAKKEPVDQTERAFELLRKAIQNPEEDTQREAFILALYLARKKKLHLRQELKGEKGETFFIYEASETEEMFPVKKWDPSKEQINKIQQDLSQKLNDNGSPL